MRAVLFRIIFAGFALAISFGCANAIEIKEVTSPGGIKAWLVEGAPGPQDVFIAEGALREIVAQYQPGPNTNLPSAGRTSRRARAWR